MKQLFLASLFFLASCGESTNAVVPVPTPAPITNSLCPITGEPIDESIEPLNVGPYMIRFHSLRCRKKFTELPEDQQQQKLSSVMK